MKHKEAKAASAAQIRRRVKAKRVTEDDRIEELEKEIRELKALNRSLMKQLKKLSKGINRLEYEQALERLEDEQEEKNDRRRTLKGDGGCSRTCPECGSKSLKQVVVAGRRFERCETCSYRSGKLP